VSSSTSRSNVPNTDVPQHPFDFDNCHPLRLVSKPQSRSASPVASDLTRKESLPAFVRAPNAAWSCTQRKRRQCFNQAFDSSELRVRAKITSGFAGGYLACWRDVSDEHILMICKERSTKPASQIAPARRVGAAPGHRLRCSSVKDPQGIFSLLAPRLWPGGAPAKTGSYFCTDPQVNFPHAAVRSGFERFFRNFISSFVFKDG